MNIVNEQNRFNQATKVALELFQIQDIDLLLERMLTEVRKITNADAGSIFLLENKQLKFSYTQNETMQNKLPFGKKFPYSTQYIPINSKSIVGHTVLTGTIINIADAYQLDSSKPYSFNKTYDETIGYHSQSILAVPIKTLSGKTIGAIQLINARDKNKEVRLFSPAEEPLVQIFADSAAIAIDRAQMVRSMILHMIDMIEMHDHKETKQHANRVGAYATEIYETWAHKKGINEQEIQHKRDLLRISAMLHNIGKIAVPKELLEKQARNEELTPEENLIIKNHTIYGARFFKNAASNLDEMAQDIALRHHERWDGNGYPGHINIDTGEPLPGYQKTDGTAFGLRGNEIPIYARIVALANVYEMTNHVSAADEEKIIAKIMNDSGKFFDPEVVVAFLSCLDILKAINKSFPEQE